MPVDMDLIRRYVDGREAEQERLARLETATENLTDETAGLTSALESYAGQIKSIESVLTDHETQFEERAKSLVKLRLRIRRRTNVMFAVTVTLAIVMSGLLLYYVVHNNHMRRDACHQRNRDIVVQTQKSHEFFAPKLIQEQANPHADPVLVSILQSIVSSKPTLVKCSG